MALRRRTPIISSEKTEKRKARTSASTPTLSFHGPGNNPWRIIIDAFIRDYNDHDGQTTYMDTKACWITSYFLSRTNSARIAIPTTDAQNVSLKSNISIDKEVFAAGSPCQRRASRRMGAPYVVVNGLLDD